MGKSQMTQPDGGGTAPVWTDWSHTLPSRPLCADSFDLGMRRVPRDQALAFEHVEFNTAGRLGWLVFDDDEADSFERWDRVGLPAPNVYMQNRANGHAHYAYRLSRPVGLLGLSHEAPIRLASDIQRGMTSRLGADRAYGNRIAKNPASRRWSTSWLAPQPYTLHQLLEPLDRRDLRHPDRLVDVTCLGRNCTLFDELRQWAYQNVRSAKRSGTSETWRDRLIAMGRTINLGFTEPLPISEVRAIARSVAKWTWRRMSGDGFSRIQAQRAARKGKKTAQTIDLLLSMSRSAAENTSIS